MLGLQTVGARLLRGRLKEVALSFMGRACLKGEVNQVARFSAMEVSGRRDTSEFTEVMNEVRLITLKFFGSSYVFFAGFRYEDRLCRSPIYGCIPERYTCRIDHAKVVLDLLPSPLQ